MHTQGYNNISLGLAFFGNNLGNGHPSDPLPRSCLHCLPSLTLVFSAYIMLFFLMMASLLKFLSALDSMMGHFGVLFLLSGLYSCETAEVNTDTA